MRARLSGIDRALLAPMHAMRPFMATLQRGIGAQEITDEVVARFRTHIALPPDIDDPAALHDTAEHWRWTARTLPNGAPIFTLGAAQCTALRFAWIVAHGEEPSGGRRVRTACGERDCVRPSHLHIRSERRAEPSAALPAPVDIPAPPVTLLEQGATIEELAPLQLQRFASAQFGEGVQAPVARRSLVRMKPGAAERLAEVRKNIAAAAAITTDNPLEIPALAPESPSHPLAPHLDELLGLLGRPGTALVTYPSGDTSLLSPAGVYRGPDLTQLFLAALTGAGLRRNAA